LQDWSGVSQILTELLEPD